MDQNNIYRLLFPKQLPKMQKKTRMPSLDRNQSIPMWQVRERNN